jgi:hypothetical protein
MTAHPGAVDHGGVGAAGYRLVVSGDLDDRFAVLFDGFRLERRDRATALIGDRVDQSALHGALERIRDLGLEIISVERLDGRGPS